MPLAVSKFLKIFNKNLIVPLLLFLLSLGLLLWVNVFYILPLKALDTPDLGNDFGVYWSAARTIWQGGNPYIATPGSLYYK